MFQFSLFQGSCRFIINITIFEPIYFLPFLRCVLNLIQDYFVFYYIFHKNNSQIWVSKSSVDMGKSWVIKQKNLLYVQKNSTNADFFFPGTKSGFFWFFFLSIWLENFWCKHLTDTRVSEFFLLRQWNKETGWYSRIIKCVIHFRKAGGYSDQNVIRRTKMKILIWIINRIAILHWQRCRTEEKCFHYRTKRKILLRLLGVRNTWWRS